MKADEARGLDASVLGHVVVPHVTWLMPLASRPAEEYAGREEAGQREGVGVRPAGGDSGG